MAISRLRPQWRFSLPAMGIERVKARREARSRLLQEGFSRRRFLRTASGVPGLLMLTSRPSSAARAGCDPAAIPEVLVLGGGLPDIHVQLPGLATAADSDPSTITDFNGHVGFAIVDGTGVRTDLSTGVETTMPYEVDLRFMKGEFVSAEGHHCHGAFALI
jgi:hypothetical protein